MPSIIQELPDICSNINYYHYYWLHPRYPQQKNDALRRIKELTWQLIHCIEKIYQDDQNGPKLGELIFNPPYDNPNIALPQERLNAELNTIRNAVTVVLGLIGNRELTAIPRGEHGAGQIRRLQRCLVAFGSCSDYEDSIKTYPPTPKLD